jgi:hypothetical protein
MTPIYCICKLPPASSPDTSLIDQNLQEGNHILAALAKGSCTRMFRSLGADCPVQLELLAQRRSVYRINYPGKSELYHLYRKALQLIWAWALYLAVCRNQRESSKGHHV